MDAQRFGRALGVGTRAAAKAMVEAADAAVAPNPTPVERAGEAGRVTARAVVQTRTTSAAIARRGMGRAVWGPAMRAGGVLWYEVTGVFFGLFALAAGAELWKRHLDLLSAGIPREKALAAAVMLVAFSWFTVASFHKARQRSRRA